MLKLDKIAEELFNKIRGRFSNVTLGTEVGEVTTDPGMARFFEFDYQRLGKVSVSLDEKNGVVVMYSKELTDDTSISPDFYNLLKELRVFAKKRMLNFDTRDLAKSNLNKRDYKFLATTRSEDGNMTESKLYGTSKVSYQNIGEARLVIKHNSPVNYELAAGRTQNINSIYIESSEGERFKYPYKHLSGARAMAMHVSEGGKPFDDFGTHITSLSEEMAKLRKFKNYMGRSAVMAESLAGYMDAVHERIATVKKTIESLQRPNYYKEAFAAFEKPMLEDVPEEIASNWIDQLTIKQFNEELQDVFPYIYKLVSEATKAKELGPDDLDKLGHYKEEKAGWSDNNGTVKKYEPTKKGPMPSWRLNKDGTATDKNTGITYNRDGSVVKTKEEIELEQAFEQTMGQFAEGMDPAVEQKVMKSFKDFDLEANEVGAYGDPDIKKAMQLVQAGKIEDAAAEIADAYSDQDGGEVSAINDMYTDLVQDLLYVTGAAGTESDDDTMDVKNNSKGQLSKDNGEEEPKEEKTPLGEFVLSYFDKETGQFPKGETAVLTMVEKDYGEQFIEPAKAFIEQVTAKFNEWQMSNQPQQMEAPDTGEYDRMRELAGLR
jgi:hypothetical protein